VLPWNDVDAVEELLGKQGRELAAVILEPLPFSNIGGEEPQEGFIHALRRVTRRFGIPLLFDEVITSFRLGLGGAAAHYGVTPDLHIVAQDRADHG
jgi:glutamate-1-semialdehyde 2,1-aminomutase